MGFVYFFFIVTSQLVEESFKKGAVDEDTGTLTCLTVFINTMHRLHGVLPLDVTESCMLGL